MSLFFKVILIIFLIPIYSCNSRKNDHSYKSKDTTLKKIQSSLSKLPELSRKEYHIVDTNNETFLSNKPTNIIQAIENPNFSPEIIKPINQLLEMEMGTGINELLKINDLNYSYLPSNRKIYSINKGIGITEKYSSRKTNSVIYGFVFYETKEKYYSYHLVDTANFDLKIIGTVNDTDKFNIIYEISKDTIIFSRKLLTFTNDTIFRYELEKK